jgi:hypothetical protein
LLVVERDRPAALLVEPLGRLDQVTKERIAPKFTISDDIDSGLDLRLDRCIDGTVLDRLELRLAQIARLVLAARLL